MNSVTDGRSTRWAEHRDVRRRELLRAVRQVIDQHGDGLSMEQLSELSGTSKAVLYRYFTDRAGLQAAMGQWAMGVISRSLDEAASHARLQPREALAAMIEAFVTLADGSPNVYRFCSAAVNRFTPTETGGFFDDIAVLLDEHIGGHHADASTRNRLWTAGAIGFVRASTERWLTAPGDPGELAAAITEWLWSSYTSTDDFIDTTTGEQRYRA